MPVLRFQTFVQIATVRTYIPFEHMPPRRKMWSVSLDRDPLPFGKNHDSRLLATRIVSAQCKLEKLLPEGSWPAFSEGGRVARVALADYASRRLASKKSNATAGEQKQFELQLLNESLASSSVRRGKIGTAASVPFMLERTDIWCTMDTLSVQLRALVHSTEASSDTVVSEAEMLKATGECLRRAFHLSDPQTLSAAMNHVATAVLQERMRKLLGSLNAVAFVANEAILPRKSGASSAPMASPPAVPFQAPTDSSMNYTLEISLGLLTPYLIHLPSSAPMRNGHRPTADSIAISGLLVPRGVSLIVGGGYHGKSTLLRTIAAGVYNKVPYDGREFCVTVSEAVTVRAEDGRYLNNCNVSAFISNLPTPPGVAKTVDTTHFSTGEASGSTSQAANVVEAIEMGCSAFLVDEDVSAANFMARDGRMRALVMDESITPLLYRVNGLYNAHGISSVVVVGGVGDWLDVPNSVILMDRYTCRDATAKAHSVSRQFSHGHVQYGGRGVVHRLSWEKSGTPIPRRPTLEFASHFDRDGTVISLLEGSKQFALHQAELHMDVDEQEGDRFVDLSRCEQLMGNKAQLYGCGLCLVWVLQASRKLPHLGIPDLLTKLDQELNKSGLAALVPQDTVHPGEGMIEKLGFSYRPRKFEVGQALTRLRGIVFEEILVEDDGSEAAAAAETERKKRELLELWNSRRKNSLNLNG